MNLFFLRQEASLAMACTVVYFLCFEISGQGTNQYSYAEFMGQVVRYHPVIKQANLLPKQAQKKLQQTRGNFDPKLSTDFNQKYYKDKEYFNVIQNQIKLPTRIAGISFSAGYDLAKGYYLNPENTLPKNGLAYAGVAVPIGQGLWIDRRRADLKQAKNFIKQTKATQKLLIIQHVVEAGKFYFDWMESHYRKIIMQKAVNLAQIRFDGIKSSFALGSKSAIDTTEALIQWQNRQVSLMEAENDLRLKTQKLSLFLWNQENLPVELKSIPTPNALGDFDYSNTVSMDELESVIKNIELHPKIQKYNYKIQHLTIDKRFYADKLKPKIKLKYNHLFKELNSKKKLDTPTSNNFKWGIQFDYPLLLRTERGKLSQTKIKISSTKLALIYEKQKLINKLKNYQLKIETLANQIKLYENTVKNYDRLVEGENTKFKVGESYLFLVNKREVKQVEAQLKLLKIKIKYQKSWLDFYEASGRIPQ